MLVKMGPGPHFVAKCSILHYVLAHWGEGPGSDAPQVSSAWGPGPFSGDSNVRFLIRICSFWGRGRESAPGGPSNIIKAHQIPAPPPNVPKHSVKLRIIARMGAGTHAHASIRPI